MLCTTRQGWEGGGTDHAWHASASSTDPAPDVAVSSTSTTSTAQHRSHAWRLVTSPPPSSNRRHQSHACADRPAGPSCAAGEHATPAQSKRLAKTRVSLANRPRLRWVQHAAEQRARAANAPLPPAARASRATGQAAAAALQGSGSGSEPDAATGWANPQAGVLSRRRRLRAAADVEAAPV